MTRRVTGPGYAATGMRMSRRWKVVRMWVARAETEEEEDMSVGWMEMVVLGERRRAFSATRARSEGVREDIIIAEAPASAKL